VTICRHTDRSIIAQSMLLPIMEERTAGASVGDAIIKTISSRIAGGRKELNKEPSRVRLHNYVVFLSQTRMYCLGNCRYARIPVDLAVTSACIRVTCYSGDVDGWRLHYHA
jgi:hypothetical protein